MKLITVPLADIAEVRLGRQRSPKNHSGPNNRKYLRAANVGWGGLKLDDVKTMNFTDLEMATYRLRVGDILLNEASGSPTEVGKPAIWMGEIEDCAFQNTLLRVRPTDQVDAQYLLHYLRQQAATAAFARGSRGVGIHHLGRDALSKWPVPMPPLAEQRRIAAILDQADEVRSNRSRAASAVDGLAPALFVEMFGDSARGTEANWPRVPLGEVVVSVTSGTSPVCEPRPACDGEWAVLKLGAISYGHFNPAENKAFLGSLDSLRRVEVRRGDFLFSRKNTKDLVGATVVVEETPPRLLLPDLIFRLKLKDERIDPLYLHYLLRSRYKRPQLVALASGSASSMANISRARLLGLPVELPPVELQRRYAQRLQGLAQLRRHCARSRAELDVLVSSLQSRAFSGQL